ncbi:transcription factor Opi1-domain-containing protein [Cunninghamella echinulata]|nr:transcription factor Opi1-domain-containing protein [Cunninghamella echinulata]
MNLLRSFLVSLASSNTNNSLSVPKTTPNTSVLTAVKKDIVDTLRKVVDIISKYAGSSLPYHAKVTVRGFILSLPGRWATLNDIRSTTTSPMASPILTASQRNDIIREEDDGTLPKNEETAIRLLNFGQESIDMLHSISTVFSDSVDRAELWIDKLRLRPVDHPIDEDQHIKLPPIHTLDLNQFNDYHQLDDHQQHHQRASQMSPAYS